MRVDIDKQVAHAEQLEREQEIAEMQAELEKLRAEKRESNRKLKRAEDVMELGWSSQSHAGHGVISDARMLEVFRGWWAAVCSSLRRRAKEMRSELQLRTLELHTLQASSRKEVRGTGRCNPRAGQRFARFGQHVG